MGEQNISYETEGLVSVSTQITRDRDEHGDIDTLKEEIQAWREERGMKVATIGWLFSGEGLNMVFTRIPRPVTRTVMGSVASSLIGVL